MSFGRMGARGIANRELTPEFVSRLSNAAVTYVDAERVALGRDPRRTGQMLANAAAAGAMQAGIDVDRLGVVPTPAIQRYADERAVPALQITASHNPPAYNGVKLIGRDGSVLERDAVGAIRDRVAAGETTTVDWSAVGDSRRVEGVNAAYVSAIVAAVDREPIADREPLVVVDPGHGAGSLTSPHLLRELGCRVRTLNAQLDGHFPGRDPEPTEAALGDLRRAVVSMGADLGVAHDGDADRVVFVDETGTFVEGDTALAALAAAELDAGDVVVTACNASQRLVDVADAADADLEYTPIGNSYILSRIRELRREGRCVPIAGEGNGGVIYPEHRLNRDGGYVAARFLALVGDRAVGDVVEPYRGYHLRRENVEYDSEAERERILSNAETWAETVDGTVTTMDGYRVDFGDEWALVRPSGTEPYVRVYAESGSAARAAELAGDVRDEVAI